MQVYLDIPYATSHKFYDSLYCFLTLSAFRGIFYFEIEFNHIEIPKIYILKYRIFNSSFDNCQTEKDVC